MSLGHRTNLASKGKGDNSMCGKRGMAESVVGHGPARPARHGEGWIALSPIPMRGDRTPEVEHLQPSVAPYRASRKGEDDYSCVAGNRRGASHRLTGAG